MGFVSSTSSWLWVWGFFWLILVGPPLFGLSRSSYSSVCSEAVASCNLSYRCCANMSYILQYNNFWKAAWGLSAQVQSRSRQSHSSGFYSFLPACECINKKKSKHINHFFNYYIGILLFLVSSRCRVVRLMINGGQQEGWSPVGRKALVRRSCSWERWTGTPRLYCVQVRILPSGASATAYHMHKPDFFCYDVVQHLNRLFKEII